MPTIRNRASHGINVARLGRHLDAGEAVEVTTPERDALRGHPLLEQVETETRKSTKKEGEDQ